MNSPMTRIDRCGQRPIDNRHCANAPRATRTSLVPEASIGPKAACCVSTAGAN